MGEGRAIDNALRGIIVDIDALDLVEERVAVANAALALI